MRRSGSRKAGRLALALLLAAGAATSTGTSAGAAPLLDINPPGDCPTVLSTPQNGNPPFLTKQLTAFVDHHDGTVTYSFTIHSTRPFPRPASSTDVLEDCAYATAQGQQNTNPDPTNIKYGTSEQNKFDNNANGLTTVTLTVVSTDWICDRAQFTRSSSSGTAFDDFSNLVGSRTNGTDSNGNLIGVQDDSICTPNANVPEVPSTGLLAGAGMSALLAAWFVGRRRRTATSGR